MGEYLGSDRKSNAEQNLTSDSQHRRSAFDLRPDPGFAPAVARQTRRAEPGRASVLPAGEECGSADDGHVRNEFTAVIEADGEWSPPRVLSRA